MPALILILDDSELIVGMLSMVCAQLGYEVVCAHDISELPAAIAARTPDAVLCDLNMPGVSDPVAALRALKPLATTPLVLISGMPQPELDRIASQRGADAAISKDGGLPALTSALGPTLSILLAASRRA